MASPGMTPPEPGTIYGALSTLGAIGMGVLYWWERRKPRNAADDAAIAQHGAAQASADAEAGIYKRLLERVVSLEADVSRINQELDAERRLRRQVENHLGQLERLMRQAGIEPPPFPSFGGD